MDEAEQKRVAGVRDDWHAEARAGRVRADVRASWERARGYGLRPDRQLPRITLDEDAVARRRAEGPLAAVWPVLQQALGSAATEPGHLLTVADAAGQLLWVRGEPEVVRLAERVHLVAGASWNEAGAGTNGVGTALALGRPFQVNGAEHYLSAATEFTCAAAPIRDPATGVVLGAVDVTCGHRDTRSLALHLVTTAARLAEARLAELTWRRDAEVRNRYLERVLRRSGDRAALLSHDGRVLHAEPAGWLPATWPQPEEGVRELPDGRRVVLESLSATGPFVVYATRGSEPVAAVSALGRKFATIDIDGVTHRLGLRHSEIVVLLLAHPDGLSAVELAHEIYGPTGNPRTVRAELARLRGLLGFRLSANPYRLTDTVADFLGPTGEPGTGELLPGAPAPGLIEVRERLRRRRTGPGPAPG
ncbi:GAF domain-containing protein [Nocardia sp. alder85J]|uniref:GAF domain-containing protein n=1 Tax=Nocardia sp. alder85J TaxID=2862949 RepID=UPI001CD4FEA7|nr:GAF domain-containing protein [Nocardia sp. alder85J]MCX4097232.1 GAF domain-containing protein [Nocardia sp. alder85J]